MSSDGNDNLGAAGLVGRPDEREACGYTRAQGQSRRLVALLDKRRSWRSAPRRRQPAAARQNAIPRRSRSARTEKLPSVTMTSPGRRPAGDRHEAAGPSAETYLSFDETTRGLRRCEIRRPSGRPRSGPRGAESVETRARRGRRRARPRRTSRGVAHLAHSAPRSGPSPSAMRRSPADRCN